MSRDDNRFDDGFSRKREGVREELDRRKARLLDVDSFLWGDEQTVVDIPAGPLNLLSRELIRVNAPSPSVWSIMGNVAGVSALNVAATTFRLELRFGLGRFISGTDIIFSPGAGLFQIAMFPAAFLSASIRATSAGGVPVLRDTWIFQAWAAPFIAWEGS